MIIQIATLRNARDRRALQRAMGETQDSKEMTKLKQVFSTFVSHKRPASNVFKLWYQRSFLEI